MLDDNSAKIKLLMQQNKIAALSAAGKVAVEAVQDYMNTQYENPIYITGTLQRSISYSVDTNNDVLTIGTNIEYAPFVHNGTRKMKARPFITDAINNEREMINEELAKQLSKGIT